MRELKDTWGRFTVRGGAEVEAEIGELAARAGEIVEANIPRAAVRALVMLGGYGRGEGGVERRGGAQRPHNNLDFLLITTLQGSAGGAASKQRLDELFRPLVAASGVGIDTGVINEWRLRAAPCLVRWCDMRFGHKTIAGDPSFVPSLTRFRAESIEPADVLNLLVNRGTLLVINDLLIGQGAGAAVDRRTVIKHVMKAIIGYGDACLFARGDYAVSYVERQRRMRARRDVSLEFRSLYDEALEFRLEPAYERYLGRDPGAWMDQLRELLEPVHLAFEAWRLGAPGLSFDDYPERALLHALRSLPRGPRELARAGRNLLRGARSTPSSSGERLWMDLALRCSGPQGSFALAFPAVLYRAGGERSAELARRVLGAASASPAELRRAYLARWRQRGDINFPALIERLGIDLEPAERAA